MFPFRLIFQGNSQFLSRQVRAGQEGQGAEPGRHPRHRPRDGPRRSPPRQGFRGPAEALLRLIETAETSTFEREWGDLFPLFLRLWCPKGVQVGCNFSPYHTFLTFTCAAPLNCTNIKQFYHVNTKNLSEIDNGIESQRGRYCWCTVLSLYLQHDMLTLKRTHNEATPFQSVQRSYFCKFGFSLIISWQTIM